MRNRQLAGAKFRRQFSVSRYILDFYCPEYRLGIEADGGQHYGNKGRQRDELRTTELVKIGVEIIRFNDQEILNNIEGVYEIIQRVIEKKKGNPPHLKPLPIEGEEVRKRLKLPSPPPSPLGGERGRVRGMKGDGLKNGE